MKMVIMKSKTKYFHTNCSLKKKSHYPHINKFIISKNKFITFLKSYKFHVYASGVFGFFFFFLSALNVLFISHEQCIKSNERVLNSN